MRALTEFYEELLSLVYSLTCEGVSARMWNVFPLLYQLFKNDGFDYFTGFYSMKSDPRFSNTFPKYKNMW